MKANLVANEKKTMLNLEMDSYEANVILSLLGAAFIENIAREKFGVNVYPIRSAIKNECANGAVDKRLRWLDAWMEKFGN